MQVDYNEYGERNFVFSVIYQEQNLSDQKLLDLEVHYIEQYNSYHNGYNQTLGGLGSQGYKHSETVRKNQSQLMSEKYQGENNPFYGKKHTEETKDKISKKNKGRLKGIPKSTQQREKMSKSSPNKISVIVDGVHYHSAGEAARQTGISHKTILNRARSNNRKFDNYLIVGEKQSCLD